MIANADNPVSRVETFVKASRLKQRIIKGETEDSTVGVVDIIQDDNDDILALSYFPGFDRNKSVQHPCHNTGNEPHGLTTNSEQRLQLRSQQ